nr:hypothetical protein CFP56_75712 [Quercus suber]
MPRSVFDDPTGRSGVCTRIQQVSLIPRLRFGPQIPETASAIYGFLCVVESKEVDELSKLRMAMGACGEGTFVGLSFTTLYLTLIGNPAFYPVMSTSNRNYGDSAGAVYRDSHSSVLNVKLPQSPKRRCYRHRTLEA